MLRVCKNYTKHLECYWEMVRIIGGMMKQLLSLQELM